MSLRGKYAGLLLILEKFVSDLTVTEFHDHLLLRGTLDSRKELEAVRAVIGRETKGSQEVVDEFIVPVEDSYPHFARDEGDAAADLPGDDAAELPGDDDTKSR